ncbi:hypothetical protein [Bradyrhizobium canariense]|uniref:hypothetical protein n=1 Tax=Bradyrhizobium canariense TaxID=255045 RepID=UPI000A18DF6A|nr:hypothetical protein [Bradyrhizobium canariense]OSI21194.1 hypothetical protein BST65_32070 [Bradyrhizobium canariense]OSI28952.1 hypothetical protein BST66_27870 [Bradyrhizobium canariense]OSI40038.1 hypothetical protein BSZ20_27325 [Bradyrhizobium canariense]OSI45058.1 hypothetical protein BST67_30325 [Bradyrhizobium canariense]OSI50376.1 hypothetical protein BSZ15_32675 [Bradyrhizobium canariense]
MNKGSGALKAANMKWLVSLAAVDVGVTLLFVAPGLIDTSTLAILRAGAATSLPIVVLLLTGVLSHEAKARLVFWRFNNPLPGSAAFTKYGPADARVDMKALAKNVGELPHEPGEQNARWYKLYRQVSEDAAVAHAHRLYLMYRDMAAMSLLLMPLVPAAIWYAGAPPGSRWIAGGLFGLQYLVCAISARHSGARFVCNVLAVHSTKKVKATAGG